MTSEGILVSVVIPVYNGERFVRRTLAAALAQTYQQLEIVVVDDGSTDRSPKIVEAEAERDKRVRLFRTDRSGVAAARNFGVKQAQGDLIALLDADDLWHPDKLSRQVQVMLESSDNVGVVYCWSIGIDEDDFVLPWLKANSTSSGWVKADLAKGNFIQNSSSTLIRRSHFDAVHGYDVNLKPQGAEDWKFYLSLSDICEFVAVPQYLVGYRQWGGSLSRNVYGMAQSIDRVDRWLKEKWPGLPKELGRARRANANLYLAWMALDNDQLIAALRFAAKAFLARPTVALDRWILDRFVAQSFGLRWIGRRQRTAFRFNEFRSLPAQTHES